MWKVWSVSGAIQANIPGVIAKIKFIDGIGSFPIFIAVGYDSFYVGESVTENVS